MEVHFSIISTQVYVGCKLLMNDFYMQNHIFMWTGLSFTTVRNIWEKEENKGNNFDFIALWMTCKCYIRYKIWRIFFFLSLCRNVASFLLVVYYKLPWTICLLKNFSCSFFRLIHLHEWPVCRGKVVFIK